MNVIGLSKEVVNYCCYFKVETNNENISYFIKHFDILFMTVTA